MHRFLVPGADPNGSRLLIGGQAARQIATVLKLRCGEQVVVLDGSGWEARCLLEEVSSQRVLVRPLQRRRNAAEAATSIHLLPALLRGPRLELVLEKATELGVAAITPVLCQRCVARPAGPGVPPRWQSIVREAVEQSGRGRPPGLAAPVSFADACALAVRADLALCCSERGGDDLPAVMADRAPRSVAVLIGPEGGLTDDELAYAADAGLRPISLGPRTLRAETAALAVCAAISCVLGEWGRAPEAWPALGMQEVAS